MAANIKMLRGLREFSFMVQYTLSDVMTYVIPPSSPTPGGSLATTSPWTTGEDLCQGLGSVSAVLWAPALLANGATVMQVSMLVENINDFWMWETLLCVAFTRVSLQMCANLNMV